jgi:uncharacterized protein (TIGR02246 family)
MRVKNYLRLAALSLSLIIAAPLAWAAPEDDAVRHVVSALADAVNKRDAGAAANLWTLDGTYIDDAGARFAGRDSLRKMFSEVLASNPSPNVVLNIDSIRHISPNVAVVDGAVVRVSNKQPLNTFSLTLVKDAAGNWAISSSTETPLVATLPSEPLKRLSWLVGNWRAQTELGSVLMEANWLANHNFILLRYEVQQKSGEKVVEGQVIGWDPHRQRYHSWHFNGNGGFGEGVWSKNAAEWSVDVVSTEPDGSTFSATNVISQVTPTSFQWQSLNRHRGSLLVQDTAPLKVQRVSK